jgi:N-acetylglucosamine repressor
MAKIGNASLLKDINKRLILNAIREREPISRADLVKITKLALPTILRNVNNLLTENIIVEIGKGETSSGRKPTMLKINPSSGFYLGATFGRKLTLIMTDFNGNLIDQCIDYHNTKEGPLGAVKQLREMAFKMIQNNRVPLYKIAGLGVATPGSGFKNNSLISSSVFAGWESVDFNRLLQEQIHEFPTKTEFITICGAIKERWFGHGKYADQFMYIWVDYGVGGGLIIDGKIYKGKNGFAGHMGHHVVSLEGDLCYCGNRGCLETYTSITSILKKIQGKLHQGEASILTSMMSDINDLNYNMIMDAYKAGDVLVINELTKAGQILGVGIANAINMYDPEMIVLGGEISASCPLIVEEAIKKARENTFSLKSKSIQIIVSDMTHIPEAMGAVAIMMSDFYRKPEI